MERWQSGRMRLTRNQLYSLTGYLGFKSLSLRQLEKGPPCAGFFIFVTSFIFRENTFRIGGFDRTKKDAFLSVFFVRYLLSLVFLNFRIVLNIHVQILFDVFFHP